MKNHSEFLPETFAHPLEVFQDLMASTMETMAAGNATDRMAAEKLAMVYASRLAESLETITSESYKGIPQTMEDVMHRLHNGDYKGMWHMLRLIESWVEEATKKN